MLYGDRNDYRKIFIQVWEKYQKKQLLDPMEEKILSILLQHPEYHHYLTHPQIYLDRTFHLELGEINPFLHFSLHLTILEQLEINKPHGIKALYQKAIKFFNPHKVTHCFMDNFKIELENCLEKQQLFNEKAYLQRIKVALKQNYNDQYEGS